MKREAFRRVQLEFAPVINYTAAYSEMRSYGVYMPSSTTHGNLLLKNSFATQEGLQMQCVALFLEQP